MNTIKTSLLRSIRCCVLLLSIPCVLTGTANSQVIRGVEVLTLISGESTDFYAGTGITSIVLDSVNQRLVCVFNTNESDLPTTSDAYQRERNPYNRACVYLAVYDIAGTSLIYGSYLSGNSIDVLYSTCQDRSEDELLLTGVTNSSTFPVTGNALQPRLRGESDLWYARFNIKTFEFTYITYLGGSNDESRGYAMHASDGRLLIVGCSDSMDLPYDPHSFSHRPPDPNGSASVFVLRNDTLLHVVHFGGSKDETFVGVHETDDSFVFIGETWSRDIPVTDNAFQEVFGGVTDMFILRCDKDFRTVRYCSYLGGASNDYKRSTRQQGNRIHIVGNTNATRKFPVTHPAYSGDQGASGQALYVIYDASNDVVPFSGLFGGLGGGRFADVAFVDEQYVILNILTCSDSLYGVDKTAQTASPCMELLIEFDLANYQPTFVHYPWNGNPGYAYMKFLPSSFGWYVYGKVSEQVPVHPDGMRTELTGVQDAYIGRIFRNTSNTAQPESAAPHLLTITPYPNPASGQASVLLLAPQGQYTLRLYDATGRLHREQRVEHYGAGNYSLPLAGLSPGRYQLLALDATGNAIARSAVMLW